MSDIKTYEENNPRNDRIIQNALRKIDSDILSNAICNEDDDVKQNIYRNMSIRAVKFLKDENQEKKGIELAVDGMEPMIIASILEKYKKTLIMKEELKMKMIIEAIDSINYMENIEILEQKLMAYHI